MAMALDLITVEVDGIQFYRNDGKTITNVNAVHTSTASARLVVQPCS